MKANVNNVEIDFDVNYYDVLGVSQEASNTEIIRKAFNLIDTLESTNEYNGIKMTNQEKYNCKLNIINAMNILSDTSLRNVYDLNKFGKVSENRNQEYTKEIVEDDIFKGVNLDEENSDKNAVKVVNEEKADEKTVDYSKKIVKNTNLTALGLIILAGSLIFAGVNATVMISKLEASKKKSNSKSIESQIDENNEAISLPSNTIEENVDNTNFENDNTNIDDEEIEVEYDANSDSAIIETTNKIYNALLNLNNNDLALEYDEDTIEALVRYTRGNKTISNEYAFEIFSNLYVSGLDVSMFFENLKSYDYINKLYSALNNINQNNDSYDDEYNAYLKINEAVENMNQENYSEVIAIKAMAEQAFSINSMAIARGGANEDGNEGNEYNVEKQKALTNSDECRNIYDKVSFSNPNNMMSQIINKAIEEDENLGLSR